MRCGRTPNKCDNDCLCVWGWVSGGECLHRAVVDVYKEQEEGVVLITRVLVVVLLRRTMMMQSKPEHPTTPCLPCVETEGYS